MICDQMVQCQHVNRSEHLGDKVLKTGGHPLCQPRTKGYGVRSLSHIL